MPNLLPHVVIGSSPHVDRIARASARDRMTAIAACGAGARGGGRRRPPSPEKKAHDPTRTDTSILRSGQPRRIPSSGYLARGDSNRSGDAGSGSKGISGGKVVVSRSPAFWVLTRVARINRGWGRGGGRRRAPRSNAHVPYVNAESTIDDHCIRGSPISTEASSLSTRRPWVARHGRAGL
jgi:hypothetical protein